MSPPPLVLCTWEEEGEEQGTHESPAVDWHLGLFFAISPIPDLLFTCRSGRDAAAGRGCFGH